MQLSDQERDELRDSARKFLDNEVGSERVRSLLDDADGLDRKAWASIAELGWAAILVPEEHGGMGATWAEMSVILHEVGRRVAPLPLLSSAALSRRSTSPFRRPLRRHQQATLRPCLPPKTSILALREVADR